MGRATSGYANSLFRARFDGSLTMMNVLLTISLLKFDKNASGINDILIAYFNESISYASMLPRKRPVIRPNRRISTNC